MLRVECNGGEGGAWSVQTQTCPNTCMLAGLPAMALACHVRNNLLSMVARNPGAGHLPLGRHKAPGWPPDEYSLTYEEVMVARKGSKVLSLNQRTKVSPRVGRKALKGHKRICQQG